MAAVLLQEFLKKLDYKKIHITRSGKEGLTTFQTFVHSKPSPIVFLDYHLTDMDAPSVMTQMHEISPNVTVVMIGKAPTKKGDAKDVPAEGDHHIVKPIKFENLSGVINDIENEEKMASGTSPTSDNEIENLLKSSSRISVARVAEYCNMKEDDALQRLKDLETKGSVKQLENLREISCNNCGSVRTSPILYCPNCKSTKFRHSKLIEHYQCGNVSPADSYENDTCPKCRKKIEVLGVDYRLIVDFFTCNECDNKFPNPSYDFLCIKCNNRFQVENAKWKSSLAFQSIKN